MHRGKSLNIKPLCQVPKPACRCLEPPEVAAFQAILGEANSAVSQIVVGQEIACVDRLVHGGSEGYLRAQARFGGNLQSG
jgi:hypothetical protein